MSNIIKLLGYFILLPFACFGFWCSICIDICNQIDSDFDAYIKTKRDCRRNPDQPAAPNVTPGGASK